MADSEKPAQKHHIEDEGAEDPDPDDGGHDDPQHGSARKRQRVRLSCLECRRRKLSCSRELPCDRCIKSGTPERCTYESRPGLGPLGAVGKPSIGSNTDTPVTPLGPDARRRDLALPVLKDVSKDHERIKKLELEVAQLRNALAKQVAIDGTTFVATPSTLRDKETPPGIHWSLLDHVEEPNKAKKKKCGDPNDFRIRYHGPNNTWASLKELTGICFFMKETANQWLQPLNVQRKDRKKRKQDREWRFNQPDPSLDALLPSKEETDSLVFVYLDQFEQLYRIVHVPTFKKEYAAFWDVNEPRPAALTALVLTMISAACCLDMQTSSGRFVGIQSSAFQNAQRWIKACDKWMDQQSQKHRRLVHYQILCLLYLAKRVNIIKKKRFWTGAGDLVRNGMIVGLHQDPESLSSELTPYNKEMRRRIWATMLEFDLQASFDIGAPTLVSLVHNATEAPRNIDDDSFGPDSTELPPSRPPTEFTDSSYVHLSRQSMSLRLDMSKMLTGAPIDLDWEQVLHFTDMVNKELDALPAWDSETNHVNGKSRKPSLAHTLLHIQLKQHLILLHQPFVKMQKSHARYQTSQFIYYSAARDIVLMHDHLAQKGVRSLYFLRDDTISSALSISAVALHQPKDSLSLIAANQKETLSLVEKCIGLSEDRILRRGNLDPWAYSVLCSAYGMLEVHLQLKTSEGARAAAAERFLSLHYKLLSYQVQVEGQQLQSQGVVAPTTSEQPSATNTAASTFAGNASAPASQPGINSTLPLSLPWMLPQGDPTQMMAPNPDFNFDLLGSDLNELWGDFTNAGGEMF